MAESKKITLYLTCKEVELEDKTFTAYKTPIGKLNIDVRFIKDSKEVEKIDGDGYYKFDVKKVNINTQHKYPIIWIK